MRGETKTDDKSLQRLRYGLAVLDYEVKALRLWLRLKAGFRPNQPRVPKGSPEAGEWTDEYGPDRFIPVSGRTRGGQVTITINGQPLPVTPQQQVRIDVTRLAMQKSVRQAQSLDPLWRPTPQMYQSVEQLIRANEANRFEAELHVYRLTGRPPEFGPFIREWIPSPPPTRRLNKAEQRIIDALGQKYGCHGCGSTANLTLRGHSIGDHNISRSLGIPHRVAPHCVTCSAIQGRLVGRYIERSGR